MDKTSLIKPLQERITQLTSEEYINASFEEGIKLIEESFDKHGFYNEIGAKKCIECFIQDPYNILLNNYYKIKDLYTSLGYKNFQITSQYREQTTYCRVVIEL